LVRARAWDHRDALVREAVLPIADALVAQGREARAALDWETAYRRFSDALAVDPSRPEVRREAEEARDFRLGIDPATIAAEAAERKAEQDARRARVAEGRAPRAGDDVEEDEPAERDPEEAPNRRTNAPLRRPLPGRTPPVAAPPPKDGD
jgi:hypothetical protein